MSRIYILDILLTSKYLEPELKSRKKTIPTQSGMGNLSAYKHL